MLSKEIKLDAIISKINKKENFEKKNDSDINLMNVKKYPFSIFSKDFQLKYGLFTSLENRQLLNCKSRFAYVEKLSGLNLIEEYIYKHFLSFKSNWIIIYTSFSIGLLIGFTISILISLVLNFYNVGLYFANRDIELFLSSIMNNISNLKFMLPFLIIKTLIYRQISYCLKNKEIKELNKKMKSIKIF